MASLRAQKQFADFSSLDWRQPLRRRNLEAASKALDLAAQELDKLIDPSTSDEERKMRKRRLLRGPKEFRDMRGDVSKSSR